MAVKSETWNCARIRPPLANLLTIKLNTCNKQSDTIRNSVAYKWAWCVVLYLLLNLQLRAYIKDGGVLHDSVTRVTPDFAFEQNFIPGSRALHVIGSRLFKVNKNRRLSASAGAHFRFTKMSLVSDKFIGVLSGFIGF